MVRVCAACTFVVAAATDPRKAPAARFGALSRWRNQGSNDIEPAQSGGGAFLYVYLAMVCLVGVPLLIAAVLINGVLGA